MYMVGVYQHYAVTPDMDHIISLRKIVHEQNYEDLLLMLAKFQEELKLFMEEKTWVLDFFGKF